MNRKKEDFLPIVENSVSMYVCGPTVYDLMHIGNARPLVVFDTVRRYFLYKGYNVHYVQNFTDIDDKIIQRAQELNSSTESVAETYINEAIEDMKGLNCLEATTTPLATHEIGPIISMIQTLIDNGNAYAINGSVYFSTRSFNRYGCLSGKDIDDLNMGSRVGINDEKNDPADFVLWKPHKPKEPYWESPWGPGRPGWHIECSAMAKKYLGDTFDIHAGGEDLIFPHHENEIAQSESANNCTFARYWMHVGFINVDRTKMSKSLGNFFTLRDVAGKYSYKIVRFFLLNAHYRNPVNFYKDTEELWEAAQNALLRLENSANLLKFTVDSSTVTPNPEDEAKILNEATEYIENFESSMEDDFNTANAIAALFDFAKFANKQIEKSISGQCAKSLLDILLKLSDILGLNLLKGEDLSNDKSKEIEEMIEKRQAARKRRDFKEADAIRDALMDMGVVLEDRHDGVRWSFK